jgi:hypothetical protein
LISLDNAILAGAHLQTTGLSFGAGDTVSNAALQQSLFTLSAPAHYVGLGHCPEAVAQSCSSFSQEMALVSNKIGTTATLFRR